MSRIIELNCWVLGDDTKRIFSIEIAESKSVHSLKNAIKVEKQPLFDHIPANNFNLWKVSILVNDSLLENVRKLDFTSQELSAMDELSGVFPDPPEREHLHIVVRLPRVGEHPAGVKRVRTADITPDILLRWSKKPKLRLPSISELPGTLNAPLPEAEKIPLNHIQFDNLISGLTERRDFCSKDDVEKIFRVSDVESSEALHLLFYNAVVQPSPPEDGSEASFHSFWDDNIRKILELLIPSGKSIRDSNNGTNTEKLRPDYGFLLDKICPFRGEEQATTNSEDPKAELSDKLTWVYSPAPFVFAYYAVGPNVTLAAICAPTTPSQKPFVQDLTSANLRFKHARIANLLRLINLTPLIDPLLKLIGYRDTPEFTVIKGDDKSVEIGIKAVKKIYHSKRGEEQVGYIQNVYRQLKEKRVPHVDTLTHVAGSTIYVEPKGIAVRPSNEKELLEAIICLLQTLQVLHQPPSLFHRDIRWPNVLRRADNPCLWFLVDWDDAVGPNNMAANHLCKKEHSPRVFVDNHGGEVDIWGVGRLIVESARSASNISPELVSLGRWMQDAKPSPQDALNAFEEYKAL